MDELENQLNKALGVNAPDSYHQERITEELETAIDTLSLAEVVELLAEIAAIKHETTEDAAWLEDFVILSEAVGCLNK